MYPCRARASFPCLHQFDSCITYLGFFSRAAQLSLTHLITHVRSLNELISPPRRLLIAGLPVEGMDVCVYECVCVCVCEELDKLNRHLSVCRRYYSDVTALNETSD